jgi:hypothetical protein
MVVAVWVSGAVAAQTPYSPGAAASTAPVAEAPEAAPAVTAPPVHPNDALRQWLDATSWVASLKSLPWAGTTWFQGGFPGHPDSILAGPDLDGAPTPTRYYLEADYLVWWIKASHTPPLLTVGNVNDDNPGALNQPSTLVLVGGNIDNFDRSGGRFTVGYWLTPDQSVGVEGSFFFIDQRSVVFRAASGADGSPLLARPFYNISDRVEDADPVSIPGSLAGSIAFTFRSRLFGAEANARLNGLQGDWYSAHWLAGFRFAQLDEHFGVGEVLDELPIGTSNHVAITDDFNARTRFYGGQIGSLWEFRHDRWVLALKGKVALGTSDENVSIQGITRLTSSTDKTSVFPAGLLAVPTNNGVYSRHRFAVLPEGDVNLNYELTDHLRLHMGYSIVYLSSVVRPGDQIDRTINVNQLPTAQGPGVVNSPFRPAFTFHGTDFWAQGLNFGLEFSF